MSEGQNEGQAPGAAKRLIITHMTLENFKSYAGVQHIGPFHKRFSSVVGPNGSGKSNVIDAMMFVFGKKAKQLRLNKLSELIHKSEAFMDLPMCKVAVHFVEILDQDQDGDDYKVIEGSELEVSRVAYQDSKSDYFINAKRSSYTEVTNLLKAKGIDLDHNRFLILQGEVEQISLMPPKARNEHETGMLEYLEDIIGSNRLVEQIEETGKEVDKLNEERGQKVTKLKIVEKDKDMLEGAKTEAEEFIRLNRKLMHSKGVLYQLYQQESNEQVAVMKEKKEELDGKLAAERERLEKVNKTVEGMAAAYQAEKEEYEQAQAQLQRTADDFAVFERKDIKYKEDMKHLKAKEKKLHETVVKEAEKSEKAKDAIPKQEKAIKEAEATVAKMEKNIPQEQQILDALYEATKDETKLIREKLEATQKELLPWSQQTSEAQSAVDMAKSELKLIQDKSVKAREALASAQKKLQDAEPTRKAKQSELSAKQKAASKVEKQISEGKEELAELRNKESTLRSDINVARSKIEESKAASKASTSQSSVLTCLMDACKSGKIPGIHGRLGDLGSIDDKYDVAISTACGALNNIVVENTAVAQKCCHYLRKTGAGVATFLLLDKQEHLAARMNEGSNFPAPRLFDLVKPKDNKYLPAFYFALRDTLVANDLDSATKIAFSKDKRFRVVTLDGAVIDTSGTMSGGGGKVSRGGMSSSSKKNEGAMSDKELAALEKMCSKQCDELTASRTRIQALETSISQWERELEQLNTTMSKLELELTALSKEQEEIVANMSVFEAEAKSNPEETKKIKELENAVKLNEDALAKAKAKSDAIEKKVKALQQEIMDAGGSKLKMQKTKVEGMTKALEEATESISKNKVGIKASHKAIEKAEAAGAAAQEEIVQTREAIEKAKKEFVGVEAAALEVMEAYKRTQEVQAEKQASLKEIEQKYDAAKKEAGKLRAGQVDMENEAQDLNKTLKENEGKAQAWQAKWDGLLKEYEKDEDVVALDKEEEEMEKGSGKEEHEGSQVSEGKKTRGLVQLSEEALAKHSIKNVKYEITLVEEGISRLTPNMSAIAEYRKKEAEWRERQKELDAATESRDLMRAKHDGLRKQRLDEFMSGFSTITMRLKEMYQMITLGGDAELELVDSLDPFSEGIVFSVRPPKKSWKNISNLSGGEKTLSSLSLVFALHHYKPTPLYVMDEIDAALDFKNVSIVANYIKDRTKDAQFIIISLRNNMFELADRLVGIYKTHHCTKTVTINPAKLAAHLPPPTSAVTA